MSRVNSDIHYFLDRHEQEIINCCRKGMSNNEVRELLKTKYGREVADNTYRKFKANLNITKGDFLETLLDEIQVMKTQGATDASVRRWLDEEHDLEVSRATFSRFKKKYHLTDKDKDPRERNGEALTNRAITQKQITDNNIHQDNTLHHHCPVQLKAQNSKLPLPGFGLHHYQDSNIHPDSTEPQHYH